MPLQPSLRLTERGSSVQCSFAIQPANPALHTYVLPTMSATEVSRFGGPRRSPRLSAVTAVLSAFLLCVIGSPLITRSGFLPVIWANITFLIATLLSVFEHQRIALLVSKRVERGIPSGEGHMRMMHPLHPALYRFTAALGCCSRLLV